MESEPAIAAEIVQPTEVHARVNQRISPHISLAVLATIAFGIGLASLILVTPPRQSGIVVNQHFFIGYILGTTFSLSTIAAFWATMGPGSFAFRAPTSLLCVAAIGGAWFANYCLNSVSPAPANIPVLRLEEVLVISIAALIAWFVTQIPLWCFRSAARVSIATKDVYPTANENQFGIGQLLILTTVIALALGGLRIMVSFVDDDFSSMSRVFIALGIFVASAALLSFSIALATLRSRYALLTAICVLAICIIATVVEIDVAGRLGGNAVVLDLWMVPWLNAIIGIWTLIFALIARFSGFRLVKAA